MTALAHHPPDDPVGPFTVEDWNRLTPRADGSRLELIRGHFHVTPPPSMHHQYAGDELRAVLKAALRDAGRRDLYAVTGIGTGISTKRRTALIPDVVVLNVPPVGGIADPDHLELVVEILSPGNTGQEQAEKKDAYATAGVPFYWVVRQNRPGAPTITAYRLHREMYFEELTAVPGTAVTIDAAPVPVTVDPAELHP
ncbi:Uma2 family endonuclease [Saccharothrix algeriensis]|uniref:Uma2 family endonuclease n=1 Tax=Saccharothrix algeriensis TaxID=173560 RepID=A0A8T8I2E8_9PSEU|nr:Uma2 family endonuclease [Saccharothrix algeriensis]MBM7811157.1 Uma2 family endonuclease [Saccharothrix algeriensis]QTR05083.1 Uma2 family endonuclease [Saccharothrix algeriensis]